MMLMQYLQSNTELLGKTTKTINIFFDGPRGSGKTFLYSTLSSFILDKGDIALPFATTCIAETLLKGGGTVHSGFKLPVPLLDTSVSSMRPTSPEAYKLRQAVLIIIDEITKLTKEGLRCIDSPLRDLIKKTISLSEAKLKKSEATSDRHF
ncbi:hypothetical protein AVEN_39395-1 [Araneus ventricosus]|uniref:ATP-dependent DNA helicase n=1 Tax=Araneus ventricosus TaxID=182803 RepID=A0A4Y2S574_ARAVE|nr:hypothetical protein AVEN_39395-1 [Araneus ventricosus]